MEVIAVTCKDKVTLFTSEDVAKRSIEFSCHKLEGKVTYSGSEDSYGTTIAQLPNGESCTIETVFIHNLVTHL